mmetsp:Transcript_7319/g.19000  ORF Transcript_7319/g.19000 Transcript_7319/m.19000 type:complete len:102 (-) Transcript_7319:194-499(-)
MSSLSKRTFRRISSITKKAPSPARQKPKKSTSPKITSSPTAISSPKAKGKKVQAPPSRSPLKRAVRRRRKSVSYKEPSISSKLRQVSSTHMRLFKCLTACP